MQFLVDVGIVFVFVVNGEFVVEEARGPFMMGMVCDSHAEFERIVPTHYVDICIGLIYFASRVGNPIDIVRRNGFVLLLERGSAVFTAPGWNVF